MCIRERSVVNIVEFSFVFKHGILFRRYLVGFVGSSVVGAHFGWVLRCVCVAPA